MLIFLQLVCTIVFAANTSNLNPTKLKNFPFDSALQSTLSGTVIAPSINMKKYNLRLRNDRSEVFPFEGEERIPVQSLIRHPEMPLFILIPGLGGNAASTNLKNIAAMVSQLGYNVLTLPNAFHYQFVLGFSENVLPGYAPRDAAEYYDFLKMVVSRIERHEGIRFPKYYLAGVSLGALHSAFLSKIDAEKQDFQFEKVFLFNPPIDLDYSLNALDDFYAAGQIYTKRQQDYLRGKMIQAITEIPDVNNSSDLIAYIKKQIDLPEPALKWLIGDSFRDSLTWIIYYSQQIKDLGILQEPIYRYRRNGRINEAAAFSYQDYLQDFVYRDLKKTGPLLPVDELLKRSSLFSLEETLKNNSHIFLIHSLDDIIVTPSHLEWAQNVFGKRMTLFDKGGHLGAIWTNEFRHHFLRRL